MYNSIVPPEASCPRMRTTPHFVRNKNKSVDISQLKQLYQEINFLQTKRHAIKADNIELNAKVKRICQMVQSPEEHPLTSVHTAAADKETEKINNQILDIDEKIRECYSSDIGGNIHELEHESLIYFLELKRLKVEKSKLNGEMEKTRNELFNLELKLSDENIAASQKQINLLIQKTSELSKKNEIMKNMLKEKDAAAAQGDENDEEISKIINDLQSEVAKEEAEINNINEQIRALQEK